MALGRWSERHRLSPEISSRLPAYTRPLVFQHQEEGEDNAKANQGETADAIRRGNGCAVLDIRGDLLVQGGRPYTILLTLLVAGHAFGAPRGEEESLSRLDMGRN